MLAIQRGRRGAKVGGGAEEEEEDEEEERGEGEGGGRGIRGVAISTQGRRARSFAQTATGLLRSAKTGVGLCQALMQSADVFRGRAGLERLLI